MLEDVSPYLAAARVKSQAEFLERYPDPVFVIRSFAESEETGTWTRIRVKEHDAAADLPPIRVARLTKREGANRFSMITIGRSKTNDVCLPAGEISKVHAYVRIEGDDVRIVDAGSTNGTLVRGLRLEPKEDEVELSSGDDLTLGVIPLTYYTAEGFYAFLRELTEAA